MMTSVWWIGSMSVVMSLAMVDAAITTIAPAQLAKVEANCVNETYSCVLANADLDNWEQVHCCCMDSWTKCRQETGCDKQPSNSNSCRVLTSLERYLKQAKEKQCDKITECNAAPSLHATLGAFLTGLTAMWILALR